METPFAAAPAANALMWITQRPQLVFAAGRGSWLVDQQGKRYLDFVQGWAVNCLGHGHPAIVEALASQAGKLINPSPAFYNEPSLKLAAGLAAHSCFDRVFFASTGAEANEGAIKLARKWGQKHKGGAHEIITFAGGFHGRTLATMSASGKPAFEHLFEPKLPGFTKVPYNDLEALEAAVDDETVAVMLEPVQGEAGVIPATLDYLQGAERLCRARGVLLILDEVQTGVGRCGTLLAEELYGIRADVITLGKGLGGGVPLAALLARGNACCFEPGEQGGTYHGNALMTAAGLAVLKTVLEPGFLEQVREVSQHLREGLARVARRHGHGPLRGHGLMVGMPLIHQSATRVARQALEDGLLINAPQADCLRFTPALNVSLANVDEMLKRLNRALSLARSKEPEIA